MKEKSFEDIKALFQSSEDAITIKNNKEMFEKTIKNIAQDKYESILDGENIGLTFHIGFSIILLSAFIKKVLENNGTSENGIFLLVLGLFNLLPVYFMYKTIKGKKIDPTLSITEYNKEVVQFVQKNYQNRTYLGYAVILSVPFLVVFGMIGFPDFSMLPLREQIGIVLLTIIFGGLFFSILSNDQKTKMEKEVKLLNTNLSNLTILYKEESGVNVPHFDLTFKNFTHKIYRELKAEEGNSHERNIIFPIMVGLGTLFLFFKQVPNPIVLAATLITVLAFYLVFIANKHTKMATIDFNLSPESYYKTVKEYATKVYDYRLKACLLVFGSIQVLAAFLYFTDSLIFMPEDKRLSFILAESICLGAFGVWLYRQNLKKKEKIIKTLRTYYEDWKKRK